MPFSSERRISGNTGSLRHRNKTSRNRYYLMAFSRVGTRLLSSGNKYEAAVK
jgi:hypothetical protein